MNRRPMTLPGGRFVASAALFVLLVTVPALASAPAGRFTASAGVVHDSKTGLNWQQAVSTTLYTYASALTYCSGNVAALPGSGWRLPAIKELQRWSTIRWRRPAQQSTRLHSRQRPQVSFGPRRYVPHLRPTLGTSTSATATRAATT
jgi:hypothetical protein